MVTTSRFIHMSTIILRVLPAACHAFHYTRYPTGGCMTSMREAVGPCERVAGGAGRVARGGVRALAVQDARVA
jgi:hypothetical protein